MTTMDEARKRALREAALARKFYTYDGVLSVMVNGKQYHPDPDNMGQALGGQAGSSAINLARFLDRSYVEARFDGMRAMAAFFDGDPSTILVVVTRAKHGINKSILRMLQRGLWSVCGLRVDTNVT